MDVAEERTQAVKGTSGSSRDPRDLEREGVSYEMLQDLLRSERRSNKLMPVPARFWILVRGFLDVTTEAFRLEQAKDPFSRKVMLLTDEVKNARHAAQSLWALRERKLAMLALAASKDTKRPDALTPDEGELYAHFLTTLEAARSRVFADTPGALPPPLMAPPLQLPLAVPPAPAAASDPIVAVARPSEPVQVPHDTKGPAPELVTIRALGDIPPFVGPDMQTYLLKNGDIASVPPSIANLLVRRQKASIIEV